MKRFAPLVLFLAALVFGPGPAYATIDDALSFALEAADPYVKDNFTVREDYWGGDLPVKSTKAIVHQLFKGNEYWFFLGTELEKATLKVDIFDRKGTKINVETKIVDNAAAVRVLAPATGTYIVVFSLTTKEQEQIPWALAYGYR